MTSFTWENLGLALRGRELAGLTWSPAGWPDESSRRPLSSWVFISASLRSFCGSVHHCCCVLKGGCLLLLLTPPNSSCGLVIFLESGQIFSAALGNIKDGKKCTTKHTALMYSKRNFYISLLSSILKS